ncbi:MAG: hypothetical protein JWM56_1191 [Candidatus Peribacteria bacterium]|nr:hypothetical protein [Candidatus Peribacteria bacterium]
MFSRFVFRLLCGVTAFGLADTAFAQDRSIVVGFGIKGTIWGIIGNLITFMVASISSVCIAVFLLGALFMVASRGESDQVTKGKNMMIGSLQGLAVVLGSYGIISMTLYLIY